MIKPSSLRRTPYNYFLLLAFIIPLLLPGVNAEGVGYDVFNQTLHVWNDFDNYYFNISNGCFGQLTNHYNDYWSTNVFGIGVEINGNWQYYYSDTLCNWNTNIVNTSEMVYFNATRLFNPFPNYPIILGIEGRLGKDDDMLNLTVGAKNVGNNNINNNLRFVWHVRDINVQGLNETYGWFEGQEQTLNLHNVNNDLVFNNLGYNELNIARNGQGIIIEWNNSHNDIVVVHGSMNQYNAPVSIIIQTTGLNVDQIKTTNFRWYDACILFPGTTFTYPAVSLTPVLINKTGYPNNQSIFGCYANVLNGQGGGIVGLVETNQSGSWTTLPATTTTLPFDCSDTTCRWLSMTSGQWYYKTITGKNVGEGDIRCKTTCAKVTTYNVLPNPLLTVTEPPPEPEPVSDGLWFLLFIFMISGMTSIYFWEGKKSGKKYRNRKR